MHKRGILRIVKHSDGQIRNWYIFGSHLRCHVEFLEMPKGDKMTSGEVLTYQNSQNILYIPPIQVLMFI